MKFVTASVFNKEHAEMKLSKVYRSGSRKAELTPYNKTMTLVYRTRNDFLFKPIQKRHMKEANQCRQRGP
jgi:hypothetical protein